MKLLFLTTLLLFSSAIFSSESCILEENQQELIDTAKSLKEIAQKDILVDQCKIFRKEYKRREHKKTPKLTDQVFNRAKVLCGKDIFINLKMKTNIGIPIVLLKSLEKFEGVGNKLNKLGFFNDESWDDERWPFGIVKAKHQKPFAFKRILTNKIVQISCAACHTGKLPDGKFSIGMTNEELRFGELNIDTLFSIWMVDKKKYDEKRWLPELIKKYEDLREKNKSKFLKAMTITEKLPFNNFILKHIVGEEPPSLATQRSFLNSEPGIYNGFSPSINFDDKELYIAAPSIWNFGVEDEKSYGTLASKKSPNDFISEAFVYTNRSSKYNKAEFIEPVAEYLKCLKAPKNESILDQDLITKGKNIFTNSCISCHNLKNGAGQDLINADEIGVPDAFLNIFTDFNPVDIQSTKTFEIIQDLDLDTSATKVKVRRLTGLWTKKNFTSNGQIKGLDHLFCINSRTREVVDISNTKTQGIHIDLCENYSLDEKNALIEYLKNF